MAIAQTPTVSVIIPFLNAGYYLAEAIDSVIRQTFHDWEIILVDDGSSDQDAQTAKQYQHRYPDQIKYFDHPGHINRGVSLSRNLGVSQSRGEFIAFLDADDCWLPDKLEGQVKVLTNMTNISMVVSSAIFWYSWNDITTKDEIVHIGMAGDKNYLPPALSFHLYPLGTGHPPCPSTILMRRSAFESVGGFESCFTGEMQLYEDQAFLAKTYLNHEIWVQEKATIKYRKRTDSLTSLADDPGIYSRNRHFFLEWLQQYLSETSVNHSFQLAQLVAERHAKD